MNTILTGPKTHSQLFIFAHGAGAPMDSEWMEEMTAHLTTQEITTLRFEFPYMEQRRLTGSKRPPDRMPKLLDHWQAVIDEHCQNYESIFIGGKSMGGRAASLLSHPRVKGIIALGFPFHAPGKDPGTRIEHLSNTTTPLLILQGERDAMGSREDISKYSLSPSIQLEYLPDGDHSLKPRVKSGHTLTENLETSAHLIKEFMS